MKMLVTLMKLSFWLLVLFIGAWFGEKVSHDPGFVVIALAGYRIELTAWMALGLILLSWILVYYTIRILVNLRLDRRVVAWQKQRNLKQSEARLQQGLDQLARGKFRAASRLFQKSANSSQLPTLNYLLAAFSAHAEGKRDQSDQWLIKAGTSEGDEPVLTALLQAQVQLQRGDAEQALATLQRMKNQQNNPFRLELLRRVLLELKDWDQLEKILVEVKKLGYKNSSRIAEVEKILCQNQFASLDATALQQRWKALSEGVKQDVETVLAYCHRLEFLNQLQVCEQTLEDTIKKQFNAQLVMAFGLLNSNAERQLRTAERWLQDYPGQPELLLTLGRLSLRLKQWGKAQEYFTQAVAINNSPEANAELGRFFAARKQLELSIQHFNASLGGNLALPELPMPEASHRMASE